MGLFSFFNKNKKNLKQIAKYINLLLNNEEFLEDLIANDNISYDLSEIIKYYILSNEKKCNYGYKELIEIIRKFNISELDLTNYEENIILANSSNGYLKKYIEKNGFNGINFDFQLSEELDYIEKKLNSENGHFKFQNRENNHDYIFFTTPGSLVVEYAMKISPERLYLGILYGIEMMPYILGEGKISYCKRYLEQIIQEKGLQEDDKLEKYIDDVLNKLCSEDPIINLFPAETKQGQLEAYTSFVGNGKKKKIRDFVTSTSDLFVNSSADFSIGGSAGGTNVGDLVTDDVNKISKSEIGTINIPDWFKCLEISAKQKGYKVGDEIDILTFKKIELNIERNNNMEQLNTQTINPENKIQDIKIRNYMKSRIKSLTNIQISNNKGYVGNGEMILKSKKELIEEKEKFVGLVEDLFMNSKIDINEKNRLINFIQEEYKNMILNAPYETYSISAQNYNQYEQTNNQLNNNQNMTINNYEEKIIDYDNLSYDEKLEKEQIRQGINPKINKEILKLKKAYLEAKKANPEIGYNKNFNHLYPNGELDEIEQIDVIESIDRTKMGHK